jgi:hypothetical protein
MLFGDTPRSRAASATVRTWPRNGSKYLRSTGWTSRAAAGPSVTIRGYSVGPGTGNDPRSREPRDEMVQRELRARVGFVTGGIGNDHEGVILVG